MNNAFVIVFDDSYLDYAIACINSIKTNYVNHPIILVFYDGHNEDLIKYLSNIEGLKLNIWDSDFFNLIGLDFTLLNLGVIDNIKIYYKYLLWTNVFCEYDNILYLDADTIVLKPLDYIFEQQVFFAVSDYNTTAEYKLFHPKYAGDLSLTSLLKKDNLFFANGKNDMINAGVFMIPKIYRNECSLKTLLNITYTYNNYIMFADQSAISLWCHFNKIPIRRNLKYNFQVFFYTQDFADFDYEDIHIIHFSWYKPGSSVFNSYQTRFHHFMKVYKMFTFLKGPLTNS